MPCFLDYRALEAAANHQAQGGIGWAGRRREKRVFAEDTRWGAPFCPGDGPQAGFWYLAAI